MKQNNKRVNGGCMRTIKLVLIAGMVLFSVNAVFAQNIVIKGSTTVLPIIQKVSEAYMAEYPEVKISISGGGSGNGIKAIIDGTTDIAMSSRFIKTKEVSQAVEKGSYPVPFAVSYDCIVPVVHPENTVVNVTLKQLKNIYNGKITNWSELGGADKKIVVISRDTSSGTYEVWAEMVLSGDRVFPGALLQASNGAVMQAVSKNPHAIGYVGLGYLDKSVKQLSIDNIMGSSKTTLDGTYAVSRPLFLFTRDWPKGQVDRFIKYLMDPQKGQKLVSEIGFVPLY